MITLAILALVASVMVWASPSSQAQANEPPVADAGDDDTQNAGATDAVSLDGTGSFDADDDDTTSECGGCEYEWEIVTGPYDWIELTGDNTSTATFTMPSQAFVDKVDDSDPQKYEITARLTVTDNDGATDSDTVTININQRPVADIQVYAGLRDKDINDPDASVKELFSIDAVIDGPGENGNRDNEWDVKEGAYLELSGAGSTDENPTTGRPASYAWAQSSIRPTGTTGYAASGATATLDVGNSTSGDALITQDLNNDGDTDDRGESVAVLPGVTANAPVTVFYTLTVTDADGLTGTSVIRIVVHDASVTPEVEISGGLTTASSNRDDAAPQKTASQFTGVENQFIVAAGSTVLLTATVEDDDQPSGVNHTYRWSGAAQVSPVDDATTADVYEPATATVRIPADAKDGDTIDVSVTVIDASRIAVTTPIQLLVGENTPPTASGLPAVVSINDGFQNLRDGSTYTLRGVGHDADGDSLFYAWVEWDPVNMEPAKDPVLELEGSLTDTVTFEVPELKNDHDGDGTNNEPPDTDPATSEDVETVILLMNVFDTKGVRDTATVVVNIMADDDNPEADAGDDEQVEPDAFVRLNGSGSSDADLDDEITWKWVYVGATMDPLPNERSPLSDDEIEELEGWILEVADDGTWQYIVDSDGMLVVDEGTDAATVNAARQTAGGNLNGDDDTYPYFDAPDLTGFNNLRLTFKLTVTDSGDNPRDEINGAALETGESDDTVAEYDEDMVTITVVNRYYSGSIPGPDYCTGKSLGGPQTYPFDSDDDGVADTCSLDTTRRATVARQNALETLANLNPGDFRTAVIAECNRQGFKQTDYGDDPDDLEGDVCETERVTPPPTEVDAADADVFYSGTITGPDYCTNHSLGGARTYAYDSDDDGVADICSLSTTRREAIARQNGLNSFIVSMTAADSARLAALTTDDPDADASSTPPDPYDLVQAAQALAADARSDEQNALLTELENLQTKQDNADRYSNAVDAACRALGSQDFGDAASALARDACAPRPGQTGTGLPS